MGRAGFMLGAVYQPLDNNEATTFSNENRLFLSDYTGLMTADWSSLQQIGPIRFVFQIPGSPDWAVMTTQVYNQMVAGTLSPTAFAIDINSLQVKHVVLSSFESVQPDTTFEMQWVVHYEGVPSSESQYLETAMSILSPQYSSPMDILRRFDFADFRTGPHLNIDDPYMETAMGFF